MGIICIMCLCRYKISLEYHKKMVVAVSEIGGLE